MATALTGWYGFFLGLAAGMAVRAATAYRTVSPRWLRWLLLGLAALVASRYVTLMVWANSAEPSRWLWLRHCWLASIVALPLPSLLALDQLVRHPSWSAMRILRYCSPVLVLYALIMLFGPGALQPHPLAGWVPELRMPWRAALIVVQSVFVLVFAVLCTLLILRMRSRRVRLAVSGLLLGHVSIALAHVPAVAQHAGHCALLLTEIFTLAAIGHAFDIAHERAV